MRNLVPGFGSKLKAARERACMSQGALAAAAGYKQVFISKLEAEQGAPYLLTAIVLAHALGLRVEDLLPGEQQPAGEPLKPKSRPYAHLSAAELEAMLAVEKCDL